MTTLTRTLAAALTILALAGCTASLATAPTTGSTDAEQGFLFGNNGDGTPGGELGGPGPMGGLETYLDLLSLTTDQLAQLQAIDAELRPEPGSAPAEPQEPVDVAALLLADPFDAEALREAFADQAAFRPAFDHAAQAIAYAGVLTAEQRQALATALRAAAPAGEPPVGDRPAIDPGEAALNSAQQALFEAWQAKVSEPHGGPADVAALASYFETGDASVLEAEAAADYPVEELIALAASLSAEQRQTLFAQGLPGLPGGMPPQF